MMKKLLYQFDTDALPATFDNVVAYDGGADHVMAYGGVTPDNMSSLVDGTIFTRSPKHMKNTAIFIGGSNMAAGDALLNAVKKKFFANFRVSVMLDSNGSNTTAAAAVAWLVHSASNQSLQGKKAVILAGTGPVGQRAAVMLAMEGAQVTITSRNQANAVAAAQAIKAQYGVDIAALGAADDASRTQAIAGAQVVLATGAASTQLLPLSAWKDHPTLELLADANATPTLGIEGIDMMDKAVVKHGKTVFGAIGFGALKISVQRACIARLFESNDVILDAKEIYAIAKPMVNI
jgi:methylenetetrahydrofolate/methylenetetrahydromethanopterin dehydrogenase (NADP+)